MNTYTVPPIRPIGFQAAKKLVDFVVRRTVSQGRIRPTAADWKRAWKSLAGR